jgi:hypothetical protein
MGTTPLKGTLRPLVAGKLRRVALTGSIAAGVLIGSLALAPAAGATPDLKKAIWGPAIYQGASQFPIYSDLGVGLYQYGIGWGNVAPTRPANPTDPNDPAYQWPADLDYAINEAARDGMSVSITLVQSPPWANGGHRNYWAPTNPQDFANFATAAARRYPSVHLWMIWGEPTIRGHFLPFSKKTTPRRYAQLLDAAYGALKAVSPANLVIGGNTITRGQIRPLDFIKRLRLPNGRPPRMDMWGHNPFSTRKPNLKDRPKKPGTADMSDLDTLLGWLDHDLRRGSRDRGLKLFISEWTIPTEHEGFLFNFWADRATVANYLSRALRIAHRMKRVYTFGWYQLYDDPPNPAGTEENWGLLTAAGAKKPAYFAYQGG